MALMAKFANAFDRILNFLVVVSAILLGLMVLLICADITMRAIANYPIPGSVEISDYILAYITFLSAAWVLRRNKHIKMDLMLSRLRPRAQAIVNNIIYAICTMVCLVLAWYGTKVALDYFQQGYILQGVLKIPFYIVIAIIPVGSILLFIQFLRQMYGYYRQWTAP